ncbi:RluA family pseudouridine synthase [Chitinispirillales bacterium ANBcel5]|uniref:RluA family pseudouridine synthase n=1 Tax=Cellulosispirillum alkaliphilum TaxID=3039283 RepID=UPI002A54FFB0|nr:RluA family pseudouridine synthase [Chitinispirillales bacterium ANBcel5]
MSDNEVLSYTVESQKVGERIDFFLCNEIKRFSRSSIQKLIAVGKVTVNDRVVSKSTKLTKDDTIRVELEDTLFKGDTRPEPQDIPLEVLYEDQHIIAVNKPAGLVVHPGNGNPDQTLVNALLFKTEELSGGSSAERPGIVHRLDKDTSGVILVARNDEAHLELARIFLERKIEKIYNGFCIGTPPVTDGSIDLPIARSRRDPLKRSVHMGGKQSLTEYHVHKSRCGISFMRFKLHTGRTHQIRVHCSHSGFPILGDTLYGGGRERLLRIAPMERAAAFAVFKTFSRQALHARSLRFIHPFSKKTIEIKAPYPCDFLTAMELFEVESGSR